MTLAAIAGGIFAVSSATAESAPSGATVATRSTVPATSRTVADSEALAVSGSTISRANVQAVDGREAVYFEDTFEGMRHKMRAKYARKLTREFLAATEYDVDTAPQQQLQGPNPCDFCATGATAEDDLYPTAQGGSGLKDASSIDCTAGNPGPNEIGWRGANDHCLFPGDTLFEDPALKEVLPNFTGINQSVSFCGTTSNIDNTCHVGDANGASRDFDPDVWEFQIANIPALDMKMTGYAEAEQIRVAMTYNFFDQTNNANFGPITDCSDGYGIFVFPVWQSFEFRTPANCADGTWGESLQEGYWYVLCFPTSSAGGGPSGYPRSDPQTIDDPNQPNNAWYYNVTLEAIDPVGACCNTDTGVCTDNELKSTCFGIAGVFKGPQSTCADSSCCSPITDLGATVPDWEEGDKTTYGSESEDPCDTVGEINRNEGCVQDFEGNLVKTAVTPLTLPGQPFSPVDPCVDDGGDSKYVIVGFSGTEDDFESSFAADSISQGDDDLFAFQLPGPDPIRIEAIFDVPWSHVGYIIRDLGVDALNPDCSVVGFLSPGITAPCQQTRVTQCLNPGAHGVLMQMFQTSNVSCTSRYTITLDCLPCPTGACCMKDGSCMDDVADPTCEFDLGGNYAGNFSSCCVTTCDPACDTQAEVNPPTTTTNASIPDDDCTTYTTAGSSGPETTVGDLINSGCEAPDGNATAYWSLAPGSSDRLWCAFSGTYILDQTGQGGQKDFIGDFDYYELDLSGEPDDTQVALTLQSQIPLQVYVVRERSLNECPSLGVDGTDDVRELSETVSFGTGNIGGLTQVTATLCLAPDQHMILIETTIIIDCGFNYTAQLDFEPDCLGACCIPGAGCSNVAEDSTDTAQAPVACDVLDGVYRGLGTRCPGTGGTNPLGNVTEIDCCSIPPESGDILDADIADCATVISTAGAADANGGCVQGTAAAFQDLGTVTPGTGPTPSAAISVAGTTGKGEGGFPVPVPIRDRDIYSFDIPAGTDAEMLFFIDNNFNEFVRILDVNDFDPTGTCDFNTQGLSSFTIPAGTCVPGGQTFAISGTQTTGLSNCLDAGETHYIYVAPFGEPACSVEYRFSFELYECRVGACCLDNSLCFGDNDVGFLQCEAILGGEFVPGASCPTGDQEGTLCLGVCCLDDDMDPQTPVVCTTGTLFQDCCVGNGALEQPTDPNAPGFFQGEFLGYEVGDPPVAECSPNACLPSGACCIDSAQGYSCVDDQTPDDCATAGGLYQGDNTLCSNSPCDALRGACCVGVNCLDNRSDLECQGLGGTFQGVATDCANVQCAQVGACCWACPDGETCVDGQTFDDCKNVLQGLYAGDASTCGSNVCDTICRADLDGDGDVTVFDFGVFGPNFGTGTTRCQGDLDCDGDVDVFDFGFFGPNFGCTGPATNTCP